MDLICLRRTLIDRLRWTFNSLRGPSIGFHDVLSSSMDFDRIGDHTA